MKIMGFKKISPYKFKENIFNLLDNQWLLVTAGNKEKFNCMTASWGGFGILWNKPVSFIFIRPTRYTYYFTERSDRFTLCSFEKKDKKILNYCGKYSGKDHDKIKDTGLKPLFLNDDVVIYQQARLAIVCKKIYYDDIKEKNFIEKELLKNYPQKDYHRLYVGEIETFLLKKD